MGTEITAYAQDMASEMTGAVYSYSTQAFTANGTTSPYFPVSAPGGFNLGGILVSYSVVYTATAASGIQTGADALDGVASGYEVSNTQGGTTRLKTITRKGMEEAERIFLAPATTTNSFVYPRASPAAFTASGTATATGVFFVPASGGDAAYIRFQLPTATAVYTTAVTATVQFTLYAVPTLNTLESAVQELVTPAQPTGQVDYTVYIPAGMSVSYCDIIGYTGGSGSTGTATLSRIVVESVGGSNFIDLEDAAAINAGQSIFPVSPNADTTTATILNFRRQRARRFQVTGNLTAGFASGLDFLFMDLYDGAATVPAAGATATAVPPLAKQVGTSTPGGSGVQPASGASNKGRGTANANSQAPFLSG